MGFILKIFFSGLIAFVPSADHKELTVLLLETQGHSMADGKEYPHHHPVLLARAKGCKGDCNSQEAAIAESFYADRSVSQAATNLASALQGGGAWQLENVDLSIRETGAGDEPLPPLALYKSDTVMKNGRNIPMSSDERRDYRWVADLKRILPSFGELNPALFGPHPPKAIVAARLRLTSGALSTYTLVRVNGEVQPILFRASASTSNAPYRQAVANWVQAEIQVPGNSVEIVGRNFDDGTERSMTLSTEDGGVVEMAILNVPPLEVPWSNVNRPTPQPGRHFEIFYDLAKNPPPFKQRPIPRVGVPTAKMQWDKVHPHDELKSPLLSDLGLDAGKGPYDVLLCPVGGADPP
jgi:hypothetical protein